MDGGTLHSDMKLSENAEKIAKNSKVHVKARYGDVYEVEITECTISLDYRNGFMAVEDITTEQHIWQGGGGDTGGGGDSAPVSSGEWSDFVM